MRLTWWVIALSCGRAIYREVTLSPRATNRTISVVIPCYNDAQLLRRCLASFAAQIVPADEVIVVDNGSTDDSAAVAWAAGVRVVHEPRRGITWATRTGFDSATGDVLFRTDADVVAGPTSSPGCTRPGTPPRRPRAGGSSGSAATPLRTAAPLGWLASALYLGTYRLSVGAALGHPPFFGTNYSVRADWWRQVRDRVDSPTPSCTRTSSCSFAVRSHETVRFQRDLVLPMNPRALRGGRLGGPLPARLPHDLRQLARPAAAPQAGRAGPARAACSGHPDLSWTPGFAAKRISRCLPAATSDGATGRCSRSASDSLTVDSR